MEEEARIRRYEVARRYPEGSLSRPSPYVETMEMEEAADLHSYWRIISKRRWTIITILSFIVAVTLVATLKQTPVYQAAALLEIQRENPEIPTVQEMYETEVVSYMYLGTQFTILRSNTLARRVIEKLGLHKNPEFNPEDSWLKQWLPFGAGESDEELEQSSANAAFSVGVDSRQAITPPVFQKTLKNFEEHLLIVPVRGSRLVEIRFESEDRQLAANVVNTIASDYIEMNLEARWEATQKASEWLSKQLLTLKARLEKSEEELQEYARTNGLLFLVSEEGVSENVINDRLRALQEEITRAEADRYQKEALHRMVETGELESVQDLVENKLIQELEFLLADQKRKLANLTTTFTPEYPRVRELQSQINEIESTLARERERAAERIKRNYEAAVNRETLVRKAFEVQQEQANLIAAKSVQYNILRREVQTNEQLYNGLLQRLKQAGVSAGLRATNVRIVDPAEPPEKPARPKPLLNLALAVFVGLGLGVGTSFLQEYLDNTLKTAEDVQRYLRLPALALIPALGSVNGSRARLSGMYNLGLKRLIPATTGSGGASSSPTAERSGQSPEFCLIDTSEQHSVLGEAFRGLRTSVLLSTADRPPRSLTVTSAQPSEGKTTVVVNLAISMAQLGQRVLLIDGDMRRPSVHRAWKIKEHLGLVSYLTGQHEWRSVVRTTLSKNVDLLLCGPMPPNPAELLASEGMRTLISEAMKDYDFVLVDSPPLLNLADGRILISLTEGTLLVVQGGKVPRTLVQRALGHVREVGGHVIGVVLNNLNLDQHDYYYYEQYYGYGSEEKTAEDV